MKSVWFLIGPPGSKWSSFANLISLSVDNIDLSDHTKDRFFQHREYITHEGAYFGPGFGVGEQWHDSEYLTRSNLLKDIEEIWDLNNNKIKLVKSHVLALNLEKLRSEFPESKFIFVLRPLLRCLQGWTGAGGFDKITYPNYRAYYQNIEILREKLTQEHSAISSYIEKQQLRLISYSGDAFIREFSIQQSVLNNLKFSSLDNHLLSYRDVQFAIEN